MFDFIFIVSPTQIGTSLWHSIAYCVTCHYFCSMRCQTVIFNHCAAIVCLVEKDITFFLGRHSCERRGFKRIGWPLGNINIYYCSVRLPSYLQGGDRATTCVLAKVRNSVSSGLACLFCWYFRSFLEWVACLCEIWLALLCELTS